MDILEERVKKDDLFRFTFFMVTFGLALASLGYVYDRVSILILLLIAVLHGLLLGYLNRVYPQFISGKFVTKELSIMLLLFNISLVGGEIVRSDFTSISMILGYCFVMIYFFIAIFFLTKRVGK